MGKITVQDLRSIHANEVCCTWRVTPSDCKRYAKVIYGLALPVSQKCWAALTESQIHAAAQLGISCAEEWDNGTANIFRSAWWDLSACQCEAVRSLGMDAASWGKIVQKSQGTCEKCWEQLTEVERREAKEAGITTAEAWVTASSDEKTRVLMTLWAKSWAQLTELEHQAANELGITSEDDWDDASWKSGGVWQKRWVVLTDEQKEAARQLGISTKNLWNKASRDKLEHHWAVTPWMQLSVGQQMVAGRLGYNQASWICPSRDA